MITEDKDDFITVGGVQVPSDFAVECKWVTPYLALGGMIGTGANMQHLRACGITHVLDLQAEFDDSLLGVETGVTVLWLAVPETSGPVPPELIAAAVAFATRVLSDPGHRLFVHCLAGRRRAPTFTYAILRSLGYEQSEAIEAVRTAEPKAFLEDEHLRAVEVALLARSNGSARELQKGAE